MAVLAAALMPRPARALVLSEDPLDESSAATGIIARSFTFLLVGDPLDEAVGLATLDLRPYFVLRTPSWKLVIHDQLTTSMQSQDLTALGRVGIGLPPPRFLPLGATLEDGPTLAIRNQVDWVYAAYDHGDVTVTVGRQPVTFGRGRLWKPLDVVERFALTEVDTEYKPGADAVRIDWSPSSDTTVIAVASAGELQDDHDVGASWQGSTAVVRAKHTLGDGELGGLAGYVRGDVAVGVDGIYAFGPVAVYGEALVSLLTEQSLTTPLHEPRDVVAEAVVGATYRPTAKLAVGPELIYNGFGGHGAIDYLSLVASERFAIGEQIFLGQTYAAAYGDWEAHPLLHLFAAPIVNVRDPSALLSAGLSYSVADNTQAVLGGYVPVGDRDTEYGGFPSFLYLELKAVL